MASWSEVEREAPGLAARARAFFDSHVPGGLRPPTAGLRPAHPPVTECGPHGELWIGSMSGAVKALDLRRDSRFALHSGSDDPPAWSGDAKVAGRAEEVDDDEQKASIRNEGEPAGDSHLFRLDVTELVVVGLNEARDRMVIESWHEGRGVERRERT
ncbi:MAG: pyridoxamine 5'-phosphate oxidase [Thermoleophilaceae bacterium]|nr:pyridoxamine 5'-phosphate oxidase [Thermoleophilaceae bacterium]